MPEKIFKKKIIMCVNELSYSGVPVYTKNLCRILDEYDFCIWSLSEGEYRAEFEKNGIPVEVFENPREAAYKLESRKEKYAACIVHSAYSFRFYEVIKEYLPTVWYIHEGKLLQSLCNLWEELRSLLRHAPNVICVSEYVADIVRKVTGNTDVKVIHNIAYATGRKEETQKRVSENKIRFAQLGTIEFRKGWDVLLSAVEMFEETERSRFEVFLAGRISKHEGAYAKEIMERTNALENVQYLGYLQGEEKVEELYRRTDVVIVASRDEASSLCALEAASRRIPLILNDSIGAKYLCEGCLPILQTGNADELYHAMHKIINHKVDFAAMGRRTYENYLKYADEKSYAEANRQVIEALLSRDRNEILITIIIEVKSGGEFLFETIHSIMRQEISERVQVLLCCLEESIVPELSQIVQKISVKQKSAAPKTIEASCVAADECLGSIRGRFFTICEEGTTFGREYLRKITEYFEQNASVEMVVSPLWGDGRKRLLQDVFYEKERIVYCGKNPEIVIEQTNSVFYRRAVLTDFGEFDGEWDFDLRNAYSVMIHRKLYGVRGEQKNSSVYCLEGGAAERNLCQADRIRAVYLWLIHCCIAMEKRVHPTVQYLIAQDMKKRLKEKASIRQTLLSKEGAGEKNEILAYVMSYVDDKIIYSLSMTALEQKIFWLRKKYGETSLAVSDDKKAELKVGDHYIGIVYKPLVCYQFADLKEDFLRIEGYVPFPLPELAGKAAVVFLAGSKRYIADRLNNHLSELIWDDEIVCERLYFRVDIPLEETDGRLELECSIHIEGYDNMFLCERFRFERFFPVADRYQNQFYYAQGRMLVFQNGRLVVSSCKEEQLQTAEEEYESEINNKEVEYFRGGYADTNAGEDLEGHIWLIWDRDHEAGDNGEALFRYLMENPQGEIKCYFVIEAFTKDYLRLKREFHNIVPAGSVLHKRLFIRAERLIGSQTDSVFWPLDGEIYRDIISSKKFVFLQHGITKNDMSQNYARYWQNIRLFVTAAKPEYESVKRTANYGFDEGMVQLLGFPRYDLLKAQKKKYIAVCPTWRLYCVEKTGNGRQAVKSDFLQSEYFQFYYRLLSDKRFQELLEKYHYSVLLMQHSLMKESDECFENIGHVKPANTKMTYRDMISEAAILISDYSSVTFDFAYLEKPVIYCQFDRDLFYDTHTYQEGYFDYERDGFGEVTYDVERTVDCVERYLSNGCIVEEEYAERSRNFFGFRDKNNCKRVTDAIRGMKD